MALSFPVGFRIHIPEPVEVKMVSLTLQDRDAISVYERYKGLWTYVVENDTFYYLSEGVKNENWKPFGKVQAVEILDVFTDQSQAIVSGYGLKNYLLQNYYTKQELDARLAGLQIPAHLASINPEDVQKLKEIQGDISEKIEFNSPKTLWIVQHPPGKECVAFNSQGRQILGRKVNVSDTITSFNWSKPLTGYVKIN